MFTLPPALAPAGASALAFRGSRAGRFDRVGRRAEFVCGNVRNRGRLPGGVRGMARGPAQLAGGRGCSASSVARVHRLTADLLDASRVEQGLLQLRRQPTDLAELVRDTTDGLRMPHATLAVEVPDELLAEVDPDRLQQVLENLLSNARTHAPGSPVVVTLRREDRDTGTWAVLRVHDQGPGIAPPA